MLLLKMLLKTSYHQFIIPEVQITQKPKFTRNTVTIYYQRTSACNIPFSYDILTYTPYRLTLIGVILWQKTTY